MPSMTQRLKDEFYEHRPSVDKGELIIKAMTVTKTSLIKWIHAVSKFIALIFHVQVVKCWWIFQKRTVFKFKNENRCLEFTSSIKREFRQFQVVVVPWWQRNIAKSVMHVQSFLLLIAYCVRGTRTQPLICVGCSVHYWVSCAINKGGFFRDCIRRRRRHTFAFWDTFVLRRLLTFCLTLMR